MEKQFFIYVLTISVLLIHATNAADPCLSLGGAVALGMENFFIRDEQIKASSTCNCTTHPPEDARYQHTSAWTSAIADDMQFLQVDLEIHHFISGVKIQGRPDYPQFVRYFNLEYSNDPDGYEFDYVPDDINPNIAKELDAIQLADDIDYATYITSHTAEENEITVDINQPLRFVRFYPTNWTHHIAMRVELLGCTDVDTAVQVTSVTEPVTAGYGETVQLMCDAQGYRAPTITWIHLPTNNVMENNARIQITETLPVDFMFVTSTLTINFYQEEDKGNYRCKATNEEYLTSLSVDAVSDITRTDPGTLPTLNGVTASEVKFFNSYFYEFSSATLTLANAIQYCLDNDGYLVSASDSEEQAFIRAFIATPDLDPNEKYWVDFPGAYNAVYGKYGNSQLNFLQLATTELHRYICKYGEVTVIAGPPAPFPLWSSSEFEVTCTITSNPSPVVKWYKDDVELIWDPPVGNIHTLTADSRFTWDKTVPNVHKLVIVADFQLSDLATYKCEGDNNYFVGYEEITLPPATLPYLKVRQNGTYIFNSGYDVELICETACYPHAELWWYRDGVNISTSLPHVEVVQSSPSENSNIVTLTLKLNGLVTGDIGTYTCGVLNQKGLSEIAFKIPEDVTDYRDLSEEWYAVDKLVVKQTTCDAVIDQVSQVVDGDENRSLTDDELTIGEDFVEKVTALDHIAGNSEDDVEPNLKNMLNIGKGLIGLHQSFQTQRRSMIIIENVETTYRKTAITLKNGTEYNINLQKANARVISTVVTEITELSASFQNFFESEDDNEEETGYTDGRVNTIEISQSHLMAYLDQKVTFSAIYFSEVKPEISLTRRRKSITDTEPTVTTKLNTGVMSCVTTADREIVTDLPLEHSLAHKEDVVAEHIEVTKEVGKRLINTHEVATYKEAMCRFWNYETKEWDDEGILLVEDESDKDKTSCTSTHTTNFAVLMQVSEFEMSSTDAKALEIITYIGCGISIATLLFTIILFQWLDTLRSERTTIHKNLIIAIILAQVVFLAGINATNNWVACMCVAILLHFCYLAVFTWMLVEGIHLYSKVVQVFGSETSKLKYYLLIGWGLPLIIVAISAAANHNGYGTTKHCWLDIASGQIWAFVAPALLIILVNLVVLGMVVRIVINSAKMQKEKEYDHIKAGVKGALVLLPILGLTWVFGLFAVDEGSLVFQYLFAIFNSLQGFFIFLFQCAFNSEVRAAYQRKKEKRALARGEFVTSTSGTHGGYETANRTTKTAVTSFSSSVVQSTDHYGRDSPAVINRKGSQSSGENLIKDDDSVISTSKVKLKDKNDTTSCRSPSSPLPGTVEEEDDVEIVQC